MYSAKIMIFHSLYTPACHIVKIKCFYHFSSMIGKNKACIFGNINTKMIENCETFTITQKYPFKSVSLPFFSFSITHKHTKILHGKA